MISKKERKIEIKRENDKQTKTDTVHIPIYLIELISLTHERQQETNKQLYIFKYLQAEKGVSTSIRG